MVVASMETRQIELKGVLLLYMKCVRVQCARDKASADKKSEIHAFWNDTAPSKRLQRDHC